jgi:hypothetical protein
VSVVIDRWTLAEELWLFGEDDLYRVPLQLADEELIRLWIHAGETHFSGRGRSGSEAAALALVELVEGKPRSLARRRRRPRSRRPTFAETSEQRSADVHRIQREHSFPHEWGDPSDDALGVIEERSRSQAPR